MSVLFARGWRGLALALCAAVMMLSPASGPTAQSPALAGPAAVVPNFDLGAQWTSAKVGKLVFDTAVTPRWMQSGDRFWYTYQTRDGRRFYMVDPLKKAKAPLFDHAKMAAALTAITRRAVRRPAPAVLEPQVREERRGLRVRRPGPARRRDRHHRRRRSRRARRRPCRVGLRRNRQDDEVATTIRSSRGSAARAARRPRRGRRRATGRCGSSTTWRPAR